MTCLVSPEALTAHFIGVGNNQVVSRICVEQCEVKSGEWGWWVWVDNQPDRQTEYFERTFSFHPPGYNNVVFIDHQRHRTTPVEQVVQAMLAVGA